ncbi:hypothetical protein EIN_057160 [Entamoeba invadens IP1]|uniref:hypothetical protein n=1 Tax=Entamoeba invadens IP1 TaxID=370355 RepID=UPI0002C3E1E4|nr:hypothetical protein EIN_057160 [Entamoeba invadens IP1]ELP93331.1 hypothetical protein EIN_057160 [Entamoeba invadens IP1]|eukprot:XP_004260102.1 hypothetical protein EIN_057160 [Entamoeba invadens IP1]
MSLSAFTTVPTENYTIIYSATSSQSLEDSSERTAPLNKQWNDEITIYLMLTYKKWQLYDRKKIALNVFFKNTTQTLIDVFHLYKSPTQIRDKVNNTKSSFSLVVKKMKTDNAHWVNDKCASISKDVFNFMREYFSEDTFFDVDMIDRQIDAIRDKYSRHFSLSNQLKSAILKIKSH